MKNGLITSIIITATLITGCSNEDETEPKEVTNYEHTYTGESSHWIAELTYEGAEIITDEDGVEQQSNDAEYELQLVYRGAVEDIRPLNQLSFSFDTGRFGRSIGREFDRPPQDLTFSLSGHDKGISKINENATIEVNVEWNDHEESFELKSHNN
ncbi:hypothetical protein ABID56_001534 [Alkalibacillus flavidus]|uniref:Lipoprotein n=1 Tax=Alkalibacillus flavidus TaxID=546021 RepID=A0ABV2KVQ7_9BACI